MYLRYSSGGDAINNKHFHPFALDVRKELKRFGTQAVIIHMQHDRRFYSREIMQNGKLIEKWAEWRACRSIVEEISFQGSLTLPKRHLFYFTHRYYTKVIFIVYAINKTEIFICACIGRSRLYSHFLFYAWDKTNLQLTWKPIY